MPGFHVRISTTTTHIHIAALSDIDVNPSLQRVIEDDEILGWDNGLATYLN